MGFFKSDSVNKKALKTDGYSNEVTGLGHRTRDKALFSTFERNCTLSEETLQAMYTNDGIVRRICDLIPQEAMRQGFEIKAGRDNQSAFKQVKSIEKELTKLQASEKIKEAMIWARVYGGAAVYMGINDGKAESAPVDFERIKELNFLTVLDKRDLVPSTYYDDPLSPKFNEPKTYKVVAVGRGSTSHSNFNVEIHESRLLVFEGTMTPKREKNRNYGWANSYIQSIEPALKQYQITIQSIAHLTQDSAQGIFKIMGYSDMVSAAETASAPWLRMQELDWNRSNARAIVLDAGSEEFQRDNVSFGSLPEVLDRMQLNLAAYTGIPLTFLMGQSPSGLNATGDSDIRIFYDSVKALQIAQVLPKLDRLVKIMMLAKLGPTGGREVKDWRVEFNALWQPTDKEKAETRRLQAEADKIYLEAGVLTADEVANSRFGDGAYSLDTNITNEKRQPLVDPVPDPDKAA